MVRLPSQRTRDERARTSDPRRSIVERYRSREQYLEVVSQAAKDLVEKGYLLKADVPRIIEQTGTRWDYAIGGK
jgi:Alpha/beta hydrolase domain